MPTSPIDRRVVAQMLVGVATRQYARSLEPIGPEMTSRGTSKSAASRRFVARTGAQLAAWQSAPLDALDLVALLIDGVHVGDHCLIVALGIAADRCWSPRSVRVIVSAVWPSPRGSDRSRSRQPSRR